MFAPIFSRMQSFTILYVCNRISIMRGLRRLLASLANRPENAYRQSLKLTLKCICSVYVAACPVHSPGARRTADDGSSNVAANVRSFV